MIKSAKDARAVVDAWVRENWSGFGYQHLSTKREGGAWIVLFVVSTRDGHELDGPVVFVVDSASGRIRMTPEGG
jgi:hypothetical protein